MDAAASPEEATAVQRLLDELDLDIWLRSDHTDRSVMVTLPWTLTIAVPATTFLMAFGRKFGERSADAAADTLDTAAMQLRHWIIRLYESRRNARGTLTLTDQERALDVVMPRDFPPEAYLQLTQILETLPSDEAKHPRELHWTGVTWVLRSL